MGKPGAKGIRRLINATKYSAKGFVAGWKNEEAFREEVVVAIILTPAAFFVGSTPLEILFLITMIWLLMVTEALNSAIEAAIDRIGDEWNELSGRAKDLGSLAVLFVTILNIAAWVPLFCVNCL